MENFSTPGKEYVLSLAEERLESVNGTLLSVVRHPFRLPPYHQVVYLVPTEEKLRKYNPLHMTDLLSFYELDTWMTAFISGLPWSIWPVQPESVVDVLYRDPQFRELAEHACKCITIRFFEPGRYINQQLRSVLDLVKSNHIDARSAVEILQWVLLEVATAIHFARTGDIETNHNVLKRHFKVNGENLIEFDEMENWAESFETRIDELALELKGAIACSKIDWGVDLAKIHKLGEMAMGLRTLAA